MCVADSRMLPRCSAKRVVSDPFVLLVERVSCLHVIAHFIAVQTDLAEQFCAEFGSHLPRFSRICQIIIGELSATLEPRGKWFADVDG